MTSDKFIRLMKWYDTYAQSYRNGDSQLEDAVNLKYEHTKRVCEEMEALCRSLTIDEHTKLRALIAALLHDVSRFEQFKQYRTFSDKRSWDHALMAVDLVEKFNLLNEFAAEDANDILNAIRYHNAVTVPLDITERQRQLCCMLRDADKLDIYKIALDYYIKPHPMRKETVQIGIADGDAVTPEICNSVRNGSFVAYDKIQTINDFKLIQAGWIYDLNFTHSFQCVYERKYLDGIRQMLPKTSDVISALDKVEQYLLMHCKMEDAYNHKL